VTSVTLNIPLVSAVSAPPRSLTVFPTEMLFEQHLSSAEQGVQPAAPALSSADADQISLPTDPASPEISSILAKQQDLKWQAARDVRTISQSSTKAIKMQTPVDDDLQQGETATPAPHISNTVTLIVLAADGSTKPIATEAQSGDAQPNGESSFKPTIELSNGKRSILTDKSSAVPSGDKDGCIGSPVSSRATPDILMHMPDGGRAETKAVSAIELPSLAPPRALDLSHSGWFEQMARDIVDAKSKDGALTFRLMPQHLGSLEIQLSQRESGLAIEMRTSNENAAQIIASAETRLTDELRQRGVTISESSVQSGASGDGRQARSAPNPEPLLPFRETEQISHPDEDQRDGRPSGRFA